MSNMSYCRFENTNSDLEDCRDALVGLIEEQEGPLNPYELKAAKKLAVKCLEIVQMLAEHVGVPNLDDLTDADMERAVEAAQDTAVEGAKGEEEEEEPDEEDKEDE